MGTGKSKNLKKVLDAVPSGYLVDANWFTSHGIAYETFRDYVKRGWLERVHRGVFRRPVPSPSTSSAIDWKGNYILDSTNFIAYYGFVIQENAMSKSTISTRELFKMFPDQETARVYLESRRWADGVSCPHCGGENITARKGKRLGYYRCRDCKEEFTVRTGTIFERSHVKLDQWIHAMYLVVTARKGISSMQLAKEIGVTQKTAWFVLGRLREACGDDFDKLSGIIEIDEAYVGGKEANKHANKKLKAGRGPVGKVAVMGARERGGKTVATPVANADGATARAFTTATVEAGSTVYTDESTIYKRIPFEHDSVNHSAGEYVRDDVHTNGMESVWALLKRSIHGTWHHVSPKHLHRYVNEASMRLNEGRCQRHTLDRLDSFADSSFKHRITYKELVA